MANHSAEIAVQLINRQVPEQILRELVMDRNNNVHYKRAVMQALKGIAKHSLETAKQIVDCGGLSAFLICLEDPDVMVYILLSKRIFHEPHNTTQVCISVKRGSMLWHWMHSTVIVCPSNGSR